jgi:hypothetical protein
MPHAFFDTHVQRGSSVGGRAQKPRVIAEPPMSTGTETSEYVSGAHPLSDEDASPLVVVISQAPSSAYGTGKVVVVVVVAVVTVWAKTPGALRRTRSSKARIDRT